MKHEKQKHALWDKPMPEANGLFLNYYHQASKDIAEEEEDLLDKFIEWDGVENAQKTVEQLTEIIESEMLDQEIEDFMYNKLDSDFIARKGDSRNWLIRIRDYLRSKINS